MSAFICSEEHIGEIAAFADPGDEKWAGQILLDENIRSYKHRYPDSKDETYVFEPLSWEKRQYADNPVQVLKLIASLRYQSCETDDYHTTHGYHLLNKLENKVIRLLPGWENAQWTV